MASDAEVPRTVMRVRCWEQLRLSVADISRPGACKRPPYCVVSPVVARSSKCGWLYRATAAKPVAASLSKTVRWAAAWWIAGGPQNRPRGRRDVVLSTWG